MKTTGSRPPKLPRPPGIPELPDADGDPKGLTFDGAKSQRDTMREAWDAAIAAGRIATGGDLNRSIGKKGTYSLGKKWAARWREELPPDRIAELAAGGRP